MGLVFGGLIVGYLAQVGFHVGDIGFTTGFLLGNTIYPDLTLSDTINLTIVTFIITVLAGLYPAWMASHMEPVEALHGAK